jgi:hypothetical protein
MVNKLLPRIHELEHLPTNLVLGRLSPLIIKVLLLVGCLALLPVEGFPL